MAAGRGEFGSLLRTFRSRALLSQEALAERAEISVRALRDLERGRVRQPHASTIELLTRALNLAADEREQLTAAATSNADPRGTLALPPAVELVGRDHELDALTRRLDALPAGTALVISGRPGVGKTALAVAIAHRLGSERFPDGVLFLPLRGMSAPLSTEAALRSILRGLGVAAPPGASADALEANARLHAAGRRLLLVLDDAAHESQVRPLLVGGERCRAIVTSRAQLSGLEPAKLVVLHGLARPASVELLRQAGAKAGSESAYETVAGACGDLPLALRIAASKLAARDAWSVDDLATKLTVRHRLDVLAAGDTDVRSSIKLSVDALSAPARSALLCMASCGTPVVPDWLGANVTGMPAEEFSAAVEQLLDASLLDSLGFAGGASERLRLHDLIREFAAEAARSTAHGDATLEIRALLRATGALLRVLVPADARADELGFLSGGPLWREWRDSLPIQADHAGDDVEEAYGLALVVVLRGCELGLAPDVWPLALAMASLQGRRGLLADWRQSHEALLTSLTGPEVDRLAMATIVASTAAEQLARGAASDAVRTYHRAGALAAGLGRPDGELWARAGEATALHYAGRSAQARPMLTEVVLRAKACGALEALWHASLTLAQLQLGDGAATEALRCLDEAKAAGADPPPPLWLASFQFEAGRCHLELNELAAAERALDEALGLLRDVESPAWEAAALRQVGRLQEMRGEYAEALRTFDECLYEFESIGDHRWSGWVLGDLAHLHLRTGDSAAMRRCLRDGRSRLEAIDDRRGLARLDQLAVDA